MYYSYGNNHEQLVLKKFNFTEYSPLKQVDPSFQSSEHPVKKNRPHFQPVESYCSTYLVRRTTFIARWTPFGPRKPCLTILTYAIQLKSLSKRLSEKKKKMQLILFKLITTTLTKYFYTPKKKKTITLFSFCFVANLAYYLAQTNLAKLTPLKRNR